MHDLIELFKNIINPEWIINNGGLFLLLFIIFAETGLLFGFFLPGDSLLFVAGIFLPKFVDYVSTNFFPANGFLIMLSVAFVAILGNFCGYWIGRKSGPFLYTRPDTFFFKKKHLQTAQDFFDKNGGFALIMGRFVPIVRTFVPVISGIVALDFRKFTIYNVVGALAWVFSMMCAGYYLQKIFLDQWQIDLGKHIEAIALGIIFVSVIPIILKFRQERKEAQKASL
jgi:membrane-associated protein